MHELATLSTAVNTTMLITVVVAGMCIAFIIAPNGLAATAGSFHGRITTAMNSAST